LFYFWGEHLFTIVLLTSIFLNYICGIWIDRKEALSRKRIFRLGIFLNLALLVLFKYSPFIINNIATIVGATLIEEMGMFELMSIHLPLGISFFTFQGMSYLFDVYRKDEKAEYNFINVALFISMFPQLIAGPIVRYKEIRAYIKERSSSIDNIIHGINLFVVGLAYKVLIANTLATPVDTIFALDGDQLSCGLAWTGTLAYTLQIYFDFCGYSTMAIGLGLMVGIKFPTNFNFPYISKSISEFWRRWHITLSEWFRDYLYIPLGGNRNGTLKTYRNLLIVFLLCGIWHGASWVFLFWGLYHGFFLVLERLGLSRTLTVIPAVFSHFYALMVVFIGWVFFRSDSFTQALYFVQSMMGCGVDSPESLLISEVLSVQVIVAFVAGIFLSTPLVKPIFFKIDSSWSTLMDLSTTPHKSRSSAIVWQVSMLVILFLSIMVLFNQSYNPFIYFRF